MGRSHLTPPLRNPQSHAHEKKKWLAALRLASAWVRRRGNCESRPGKEKASARRTRRPRSVAVLVACEGHGLR